LYIIAGGAETRLGEKGNTNKNKKRVKFGPENIWYTTKRKQELKTLKIEQPGVTKAKGKKRKVGHKTGQTKNTKVIQQE